MRRQESKGYLTLDDMQGVARMFRVPLYHVQGLVSHFPRFRTSPPPTVQVAVCRDMSCRLNGSEAICSALRSPMHMNPELELQEVSCLGRCDRAPAVLVNDTDLYVARTPPAMVEIVQSYLQGRVTQPRH